MLDVQGHLMLWGDPGQWPTSSTAEEQGGGDSHSARVTPVGIGDKLVAFSGEHEHCQPYEIEKQPISTTDTLGRIILQLKDPSAGPSTNRL